MSTIQNGEQKLTHINDAELIGDFDDPAVDALLERTFNILVGTSAKQEAGTWRKWSPSLADLIVQKLSHHPAKKKKDGHAIAYVRAQESDEVFTTFPGGMELPLCGRTNSDIEAVTFVGLDIDGGAKLEDVIDTVVQLGYFAIVYTTHSHLQSQSTITTGRDHDGPWNEEYALQLAAEKGAIKNPVVVSIEPLDEKGRGVAVIGHDPIEKFRVIIPLEEPFELELDTPNHRGRCVEWADRVRYFSEVILGIQADERCFSSNRLFYTPSHPPASSDWYIGIVAGRALPLSEMPFGDLEARYHEIKAGKPVPRTHTDRPRSRPVLSDGFDLISWKHDLGNRFLFTDLLMDLQWEFRRRSGSGQAIIECPNDAAHSNPGDPRDAACWVKDGDDFRPFVIYCHHNSCSDLGSLEFLVELEEQIDLPDGYETFSELLCDDAYYFVQDDDFVVRPTVEYYRRWDPEEVEDIALNPGQKEDDQ